MIGSIPVGINEAIDNLYFRIDSFVTRTTSPRVRNLLMGSQQQSLLDAMLADLVDIIPGVGDASNLLRVRDAAVKGGEFTKKRLPVQLVDLVAGVLPDPVGGILDALTPSNTITYMERTGSAKWRKRA